MSLSPLVFASLADRLILRVAEKIEVFFFFVIKLTIYLRLHPGNNGKAQDNEPARLP